MRGRKYHQTDLVPLRGKKLFGPRPQNRILIPFRGTFQNFRRSPLSLLYGSSFPPGSGGFSKPLTSCCFLRQETFNQTVSLHHSQVSVAGGNPAME